MRAPKYLLFWCLFMCVLSTPSFAAHDDDDILLSIIPLIASSQGNSKLSSLLPDTGINKCYDDSEIPCPSLGKAAESA